MKYIFIKNNNKSIWLGALIASVAITAAALTYLYFNNTDDDQSDKLEEGDHSMDYLVNVPKKKHKSDLHDLHAIVTH